MLVSLVVFFSSDSQLLFEFSSYYYVDYGDSLNRTIILYVLQNLNQEGIFGTSKIYPQSRRYFLLLIVVRC